MNFSGKLPGVRVISIIMLVCIMAVTCIHAESGRSGPGKAMESGKDHRIGTEEDDTSGFGSKTLKDAEEERSYRRDNVVITVKKLYAEDRYYWNFEVTVENQNEKKKTVEGRICLYNMYIQPRECGSEECGVNMAVQPKSVLVRNFKCRGKMDMNSWAFIILTVHNY